MDRTHAIERNRDALIGIVAALFALLGDGGWISRRLHTEVLRILRPAEEAVRRLIVVVAKDLTLKPAAHRVMPPNGIAPSGNIRVRYAQFQLADEMPPMVAPDDSTKGPRIFSIAPLEPTIGAIWASQRAALRAASSVAPEGQVDGARLSLRLQALKNAIENISRQAKRLLRWKARRARLSAQRLIYTSPLRPGRPPGHRKVPRHDVDHVLEQCHWLAYEARLNTS